MSEFIELTDTKAGKPIFIQKYSRVSTITATDDGGACLVLEDGRHIEVIEDVRIVADLFASSVTTPNTEGE